MADTEEIQKLFDASQEVVRETFALTLRIADERGVDPRALIRSSFTQLQGMGFTVGLGSGAAPETTAVRPRPAKKTK